MGDFLPGVHEAMGFLSSFAFSIASDNERGHVPRSFPLSESCVRRAGLRDRPLALDSLRALRLGDVTEARLVAARNLPGRLETGDNSQEKLESPDELLSTAAGGISALEPLYPSRGRLSRRLGLRFGQDAPPPGIRSRTCQSRNRTAKRERLTLGPVVIVPWVSNLAWIGEAAIRVLNRRRVSTSKE